MKIYSYSKSKVQILIMLEFVILISMFDVCLRCLPINAIPRTPRILPWLEILNLESRNHIVFVEFFLR